MDFTGTLQPSGKRRMQVFLIDDCIFRIEGGDVGECAAGRDQYVGGDHAVQGGKQVAVQEQPGVRPFECVKRFRRALGKNENLVIQACFAEAFPERIELCFGFGQGADTVWPLFEDIASAEMHGDFEAFGIRPEKAFFREGGGRVTSPEMRHRFSVNPGEVIDKSVSFGCRVELVFIQFQLTGHLPENDRLLIERRLFGGQVEKLVPSQIPVGQPVLMLNIAQWALDIAKAPELGVGIEREDAMHLSPDSVLAPGVGDAGIRGKQTVAEHTGPKECAPWMEWTWICHV